MVLKLLSEIFHLGSLTLFLFLILYGVLMALNNCSDLVNGCIYLTTIVLQAVA